MLEYPGVPHQQLDILPQGPQEQPSY
jgi:hypothetical protein